MRIYLIKTDDPRGYDNYFGFVVRAKSRKRALEMVDKRDFDFWEPKHCKCIASNVKGKEEILLEDYNAG